MELTNPYGWEAKAWAFDEKASRYPKNEYSFEQVIAFLYYHKLYRRVKTLGKTLIIEIDGEHQTGKSTSGAFLMAHVLDPTFLENKLKRVVYSPKELLDAIQDIRKNEIKGAAIVVDEAGAAVNRQDYYEQFAKAINKSIMVAGYLHFIVIFVCPVRDQIMSSLDKMAHKYIHMERTSNTYSVLHPYDLRFSSIYKKQYMPKPRVNLCGNKYVIRRIKIKKLPDWFDKEYREIEESRKPEIMEKIREQGLESDIKEKRKDPDELIPIVIENFNKYLAKRSGVIIKLNPNRIARKLGVPHRDADYIQEEAEIKLNTKEKIDERRKQLELEESKKEKVI